MSWSFSGKGKPAALLTKAKASLAGVKCTEPEETIKNKVANIIEASLLAMPPEMPVEISAGGSQSTDSANPTFAINALEVSIKPMWGWTE